MMRTANSTAFSACIERVDRIVQKGSRVAIVRLDTYWHEFDRESTGDFRIVPPGEADAAHLPWRCCTEYERDYARGGEEEQVVIVLPTKAAEGMIEGGEIEFRDGGRGELRICRECGVLYFDEDEENGQYWSGPYHYESGSSTYCLTCWLGCGPEGQRPRDCDGSLSPEPASAQDAAPVTGQFPEWLVGEEMFGSLKTKYPDYLDPTIVGIRMVQSRDRVWLEISRDEGGSSTGRPISIQRTDLKFIMQPSDDDGWDALCFPPSDPVTENARRFVKEFDPYSIINTTDLFHRKACERICDEYSASLKDERKQSGNDAGPAALNV